jgi:hypothetical protein
VCDKYEDIKTGNLSGEKFFCANPVQIKKQLQPDVITA